MDKGKKILLKTFWNDQGYKNPTPEEFAIAVREGYMFEETHPLSHEETLAQLREVVAQVDPKDVANAFLYSLSTRALEYRSAMGSYWYAKAVPDHEIASKGKQWCLYCGWSEGYHDFRVQTTRYATREWMPKHTLENSCNFERHKFGGRHHNETPFALFDLKQFLKLPRVSPTDTDYAMLRDMLALIGELEPRRKAGAYRDLLAKRKIIPCNRWEISALIDILGLCGVLSTAEHPCPDVEFRGKLGIDPPEIRSDIAYPVCWWRAEDGVNEARFRTVFGFDYEELTRQEAIARVRRMEVVFDGLRADPSNAGLRRQLAEYYEGGQWLRDYELDEWGLLPRDLKRGVLSQDGVWTLLTEIEEATP